MAKIIRKGHQLENDMTRLEETRHQQQSRCRMILRKAVLPMLAADLLLVLIGVLTGLVFLFLGIAVIGDISALLIIFLIYSPGTALQDREQILSVGIRGEQHAAEVLAGLPDDYTVYQDVSVSFDGKSSEIDNIVVGRTGVFALETKNHGGYIRGGYEDRQWQQEKIGCGGTPYSREFYSPVKQVGTHVYRLAGFLRSKGVPVYVAGGVYFTNSDTSVNISGHGRIPVFASSRREEGALRQFILSGREQLDSRSVGRICALLDSL